MNYYLKRIYLIAILTFISVGIYAQSGTEKITVSFKDISLKEAMPMIEEVSAYTFFYDATETDLEQHVSLTANNEEYVWRYAVCLGRPTYRLNFPKNRFF